MDTPLYVLVYCVGMAYCQPVAPYFSITHSECLRAQAERPNTRCYSQWHDEIVPGDGYGRAAEPDRMDITPWTSR